MTNSIRPTTYFENDQLKMTNLGQVSSQTNQLQCKQTGFSFFFSGRGVGPDIVDLGPLPGPTRPRGGLKKAPAGAPLDLHRFSVRWTNYKAIP